MKEQTSYITTPIFYTNSAPHIGSAYTTIAADILSRWNKLLDKKVFFLTGTDEHGKKIQQTAKEKGIPPKKFVDEIVEQFKNAWKILNIQYNNFIRTTDKYHEDDVSRILQELYDKKLIYKGHYESYYCIGCEQYLTKGDLIDGKCPIHNTIPEIKKEESYLLKLSQFGEQILKAIETEKLSILPLKRRNEMISFIKTGLQDISISRKKSDVSWGIELPFDKEHTCYVWIDAFWNYWTGLKTKENKEKFWPPDVQLMANDILRVHSTIWPAILLSLNLKLPKKLFIHGYFTVNGKKMSKSLGNAIDPITLANKYGTDSLRYFLFRNIPFGEDGDFSEETLKERHNNELANKLGNLISRVSALAEKYSLKKTKNRLNLPEGWKKVIKEGRAALEVIPEDKNLDKQINLNKGSRAYILRVKKKRKGDPLDHDLSEHNDLFGEAIRLFVENLINNYEFDKALNLIFELIDHCNWYIQIKKPWETHNSQVLYEASNAIKDIAILLSPFMPETSKKIAKTFNFEISLKSLETPIKISKIKKSDILFKKI